MQRIKKLMNGILLGSLLFSVPSALPVKAAEEEAPVLSDPVTPESDTSTKIDEILSGEPSQEPESNADSLPSEPSEPNVSEEEIYENISEEDMNQEESYEPEISEIEEDIDIPEDDESKGNNDEFEGNENEPGEPDTELEEPENGAEDSEAKDNDEGTINEESVPENHPEENSDVIETDEEIIKGFEKVETPEYSVPNDNTEVPNSNEESVVEYKDEQDSTITKSSLDRLPETGIADNIEIIYIFELVFLGFALLLLSFKPKQRKVRVKK